MELRSRPVGGVQGRTNAWPARAGDDARGVFCGTEPQGVGQRHLPELSLLPDLSANRAVSVSASVSRRATASSAFRLAATTSAARRQATARSNEAVWSPPTRDWTIPRRDA